MKSKIFTSLVALFVGLTAFAQTTTIKGTVSDNIGPLVGASVIESGTSNGTVTDFDGNFTLTVKNGASIEISSVGYVTKTIEVGSQTTFNVTLEEDALLLEETVVVGYGVQKKKLVTGATVQVKGEELSKLNTTSALGAMQSSTPGMQITSNSGQPGEGYKVSIRGMGTIGSYQPLYVIDGVAGGDINSLNPSDIEAIDVLKDAASCAIYGARGANGVVLVTTKQGKSGKYTVTYDGFYGVQNVQKMPEPLNAKQYMEIENLLAINEGGAPIDFSANIDADLYNSIMDGTFTGTNWLDILRNVNAPTSNHSVNIVGGTDMSKFSFGLSNTYQEGIFGYPVQSKYGRSTVRMNSDHVLYRKNGIDVVTFGENMTYNYNTKSGIGIGNQYWNDISWALRANPMIPLKDADGNYTDADDIAALGIYHYNQYFSNPIGSMVRSGRGNNWNHGHALNLSAHLLIQPIKNLVFKSQANYKMSAGSYRDYSMTYKTDSMNSVNTDTVSQSGWSGWSWSWENTVNYKFNIAEDHHFDALVGSTLEHSGYGENVNGSRSNGKWANNPTYAFIDNMLQSELTASNVGGSTWGDSGLASFFGRINYDYNETYMLSAILRADGSSNFARGHRWGIFPSVAGGIVLSNMDFMQDVDAVNFLKLRASWGQNGNCAVDGFQYLATVAIGNPAGGYGFGHGAINAYGSGSYADKLANADISWETSEQLDLGVDARFLDSRLAVVFDVYNKMTKDWLVNAPIMGHFGTGAPYINGGDVMNRGVELALTWNDSIGKDLHYSIGVNGAFNQNRVTKIANEEGIMHGPVNVIQSTAEFYRAQVGYPIGYFWAYKTDGVFQNQSEIDAWMAEHPYLEGITPVPGDLKFVDYNNDGVLNNDDKTMVGDPNPDFTMGLNLSLNYKGLDFSLSGYGNFGQQIFRAYRRYSDSQWDNYTTEIYNYWHGEGTSNRYPRIVPGTNYNYVNNSDVFIENADFFRIQSVALGYDICKLWKSAPFSQCRVYVQAQNPIVFTKYQGMDPEVGADGGMGNAWAKGIDVGFYPQARTVLMGVNLKF